MVDRGWEGLAVLKKRVCWRFEEFGKLGYAPVIGAVWTPLIEFDRVGNAERTGLLE